jgi:hypothetical protein
MCYTIDEYRTDKREHKSQAGRAKARDYRKAVVPMYDEEVFSQWGGTPAPVR